jgi:hypothetical protein
MFDDYAEHFEIHGLCQVVVRTEATSDEFAVAIAERSQKDEGYGGERRPGGHDLFK